MKRARSVTAWPASMLSVLVLAIALFALPAGPAHAGEWPADAYVLQVDGLACPYCGYGVEKQFSKLEGVEGTEIDLENGVVVVAVAPGTEFSNSELKRIVDDAGFALGGIKQRPEDR